MSTSKFSFVVYENDGVTRKPSATPTHSGGYFGTKSGTTRSAPSITNEGVGKFSVDPTAGDETAECIGLIVTGGLPAYVLYTVSTPARPFAAVLFLNPDGTLISSGTPTVPSGGYQQFDGTALTPPALVSPSGQPAIWSLTPLDAELVAGGVNWIIDAPAAKIPASYDGDLILGGASNTGAVPTVGNFHPFNPPSSGSISPTQEIGFDVTCVDGFANIFISCGFTGFAGREEVFDGYQFATDYANGASKTTITNGFRFRFKRRGGFPGDPVVKIRAVSYFGVENV